jgi:CRISPR-associated protein Cas2
MIVITLTDCPLSLRGDLTKWLLEINTGVFVGKVSARVRDNLWNRVVENVKNGKATMVFSTNNEQHMDFRIHQSENEIIDFDGLKLVMKPTVARTKNLSKRRMGFSKASKMLLVRRKQNKGPLPINISTTLYPDSYVVLDLETSGLSSETDEIIEVGMLKVHDRKILESFQSLIKPKHPISSFIERLTGITNQALQEDGRKIDDVLAKISSFIGTDAIVGHNVNFDIGFLNQAYALNGSYKIKNTCYDTMKMYTAFLKGKKDSKKLINVANALEIKTEENHRGLVDCYTIQAVFEVLKQKLQ